VLQKVADVNNISVCETFIEARSAKEPHTRPEFERLVKSIERGSVHGILTWSINRLSRNLVDGGIIAHLLQSGKLEFIKTPDRTYRPEDNVLLLSIENGMAAGYIQELRRNVIRGMQGKRDRGWFPHRAPIGYLNNPYTREIDVDPERFPLLQKGFEMILNGGSSIAEVHRALVASGLTRRMGQKGTKPLTEAAFYAIFSNPFYMGKFRNRGQLVTGKHVPLISEYDYYRIQEMIGRAPKRKLNKHIFAYSGLFRCGVCGCQIVGDRKVKTLRTGAKRTYIYYRCSGAKGCTLESVREDKIDRTVKKLFDSLSISTKFAEWAMNAIHQQVERDLEVLGQSQAQLSARLTSSEERLERLHQMRINGEIDREEYVNLKAGVQQQIDTARSHLDVVSTAEERMHRYLSDKISAAVHAKKFAQESWPAKRSMICAVGNNHLVTRGVLRFDVDPVLKEIAALEPIKTEVRSVKTGDSKQAIQFWWAKIQELRKLALTHVLHEQGFCYDGDLTSLFQE